MLLILLHKTTVMRFVPLIKLQVLYAVHTVCMSWQSPTLKNALHIMAHIIRAFKQPHKTRLAKVNNVTFGLPYSACKSMHSSDWLVSKQ